MLSAAGTRGANGRQIPAAASGPDARPILLDVLVRVVAGAHERARGDVLEAEP
jgi:hypothetical protein